MWTEPALLLVVSMLSGNFAQKHEFKINEGELFDF